MKEIIKVLMERDGMSRDDTLELVADFKSEALILLDKGASYYDLEELFNEFFGLEPDYMVEAISDLL